MRVPIASPQLGPDEIAAATAVLQSGQLVAGATVQRFERSFADYQGVRHAVATSSGTTALMAALLAHGIGPGDEVIVPAFTFFATASAVVGVGARPVFADIEPGTCTLCPESVARHLGPTTRAVIAVHLYGQLARMDALAELCRERGLSLIEDAAQAHGAAATGPDGALHRAGSWGTACFSFHASKAITTGEGGMLLTSDPEVARRAAQVCNQGRSGGPQHDAVGFNFRMTELAAAIGLQQLRRLPQFALRRRQQAEHYLAQLPHREGVGIRHEPSITLPRPGATQHPSWQLFTIRSSKREALRQHLVEAGIEARVYYERALHQQPALAAWARGPLPHAERAAREVLSLPLHPGLTPQQLQRVVQSLSAACRR